MAVVAQPRGHLGIDLRPLARQHQQLLRPAPGRVVEHPQHVLRRVQVGAVRRKRAVLAVAAARARQRQRVIAREGDAPHEKVSLDGWLQRPAIRPRNRKDPHRGGPFRKARCSCALLRRDDVLAQALGPRLGSRGARARALDGVVAQDRGNCPGTVSRFSSVTTRRRSAAACSPMTGATAVATAVHSAGTSSSEGPSETQAAARLCSAFGQPRTRQQRLPPARGCGDQRAAGLQAGGQPCVQAGTGHQVRGQRYGELDIPVGGAGCRRWPAATAVSHPVRMRPGHPDAPTMSLQAIPGTGDRRER